MQQLDIVLPVYNPIAGWEQTILSRFRSLTQRMPEISCKLFIVNDGSSTIDQQMPALLEQAGLPIQWIAYPQNRGKGYALRQGVRETTAEYILYTDIDWPYTEESMIEMIRALTGGADVVIGVRDAEYYKHLPRTRMWISKWLRSFNARLLKLKVNDTQAGLKGFQSIYKAVFLKTSINRYLFDLEFIYLLSKHPSIRLESLPIRLRGGITFSTMNRKILFQEAMNFLKIWIGEKK